jgi:hypothetical protein
MRGGRIRRRIRAVFAGENGALQVRGMCLVAEVAMRISGKMKGQGE